MRLIDTQALVKEGSTKLVEYIDERRLPPYAILSHTWGLPNEEVLFEDVQPDSAGYRPPLGVDVASFYSPIEIAGRNEKAGWLKVYQAAKRAHEDGYECLWIDTCCIDKKSSAELSEAINSMYRWYQKAAVCYVHLEDFKQETDPEDNFIEAHDKLVKRYGNLDHWSFKLKEEVVTKIGKCRWFTRGWTLQELIAPEQVFFFDKDWKFIFAKAHGTTEALSRITGIVATALSRTSQVRDFSVAQRMYWASRRKTTRVEDEAYSLLGIFDINMPLLYGEGQRAFKRLQEAIISVSTDASIFAWELRPHEEKLHGHDLLAPSVANFWWQPNDIIYQSSFSKHSSPNNDYRLTNQGMRVPFRVYKMRRMQQCDVVFASLDCALYSSNNAVAVGLRVKNQPLSGNSSICVTYVAPELVSTQESAPRSYRRLVLIEAEIAGFDEEIESLLINVGQAWQEVPRYPGLSAQGNIRVCLQLPEPSNALTWKVLDVYPDHQWHAATRSFMFSMADGAAHAMLIVELSSKFNFLIIVGVINQTTSRLAVDTRIGRGYLQYWILPWVSDTWFRPYRLSVLNRYVGTLASKEIFEFRSHRQRASKIINLPTGNMVRITTASEEFDVGAQAEMMVCDTPALANSIRPRTTEDFPEYKWMFLDVDLYLTMEKSSDQMPSPTLTNMNLMEILRPLLDENTVIDRAWLDRQLNTYAQETVLTQAWYFRQWYDPWRTYLWMRRVDFKNAIYDRKLWSREAAWAEEHSRSNSERGLPSDR